MTRQISVTVKYLVLTALPVFFTVGLCLLLCERFRYLFAVISSLICLRYLSLHSAVTFLVPFFMKRKRIEDVNKAVLITGCDTGFGNLLAKRLDKIGFHVLAGCLNPDKNGGADLVTACSSRIKVFKLDVSDVKSIEDAKVFVDSKLGELELWAVVNNAGIAGEAEFEVNGMKDFEKVLTVNFLGVTRVTRAFLPLLRKSKGRLINVASLAGRIMIPTMSAYGLSKHSVIHFSDVLRMELCKFDVSVVTIEPSFYRTRISDAEAIGNVLEKRWAASPSEIQSAYKISNIRKVHKYFKLILPWIISNNLDEVIDDMESAVMDEVPQYHYSVGKWPTRIFCWFMNAFESEPARNYYFCRFGYAVDAFNEKK